MLNPKGFLKKDLDQAVRLHDCFNYYINRVDELMGKGQFYEVRRRLEEAIKISHSLESLKHDKLLHDLKHQIDQQGIVEKTLRWRK